MPKIAFLTGIPGAGKSYLSRRIMHRGIATRIIGDEVRRRATLTLLPNLRHERIWSESLWDELCRSADIQPAMDAAVNGYVFPNVDLHRHLIVDAFVVSHPAFQRAFTAVMTGGGYEVSNERLFWIDPPLDQVVRQANGRITSGERPAENPIDEMEAERRREILVRRVATQAPVTATSADELEPMIAKFLSSE